MTERLKSLEDKKQFVRISISDSEDTYIAAFDGVIIGQNKDFVMMIDFNDFNFDGYVVFKKKDIHEITRTKKEKIFQKILRKEGLLVHLLKRKPNVKVGTMESMFKTLKKFDTPVIVRREYKNEDVFQIGPVHSVEKKKVRINYFNVRGVYDLKPVSSIYEELTYFKFGDTYSKLFYKYAKKIQ